MRTCWAAASESSANSDVIPKPWMVAAAKRLVAKGEATAAPNIFPKEGNAPKFKLSYRFAPVFSSMKEHSLQKSNNAFIMSRTIDTKVLAIVFKVFIMISLIISPM